ncbi:MAG TPA: adenylate/guanylate cyclase domain-containing protein [Verrucomicrobiae bacterium]|jgi:class 3 adenylate cyclase|nr:adenylate/guanylate cyclase domain-containing protein [Verrucomicrobiae bacterium]
MEVHSPSTSPVRERHLSLPELAAEARAPVDLLEWLVARGQLRPLPDGRFDARDSATLSTVQALLASGISRDDLGWAFDQAGAGVSAIGQMFAVPRERSTRTYAEVVAELGEVGRRLGLIYSALGFTEPAPDERLRVDEERVVTGFASVWAEVDPGGDADVRLARIAGEATRRVNEAWLDIWDEVAQPRLDTQGGATSLGQGPATDPADPAQNASLRGAEIGRLMTAWLQERALERTLNARIINAFENALVRAGRLEGRPDHPPAVAFVDLSGYATMTVERGDEAAAAAADRLRSLAEECVRKVDGRIVKVLGDGVLLLFQDRSSALGATLALVRRVAEEGLPPAHAGIAAGRVVVRDGDVFGQTVNLASRIAGQAKPGQVLVEEGVVIALPRGVAEFAPIGRVELKGLPLPVAVWQASAPGTTAG